VVNANPNGDPMDENRPRYDDETGKIFVRDARIKRTIRDTLQEMGEEIFIREERKEDGTLKRKEDLAKEYKKDEYNNDIKNITKNIIKNILERCIDIRLFGGTFAFKTEKRGKTEKTEKTENLEPFSLTGPVQFAYGTSLHRVKILEVQGTSVLPSSDEKGKEKKQGTMMFDYRVAYALIGVYGVANQKTAKENFENMLETLKTKEDLEKIREALKTILTEEDLEKMLKALNNKFTEEDFKKIREALNTKLTEENFKKIWEALKTILIQENFENMLETLKTKLTEKDFEKILKTLKTKLTEEDFEKMLKALWIGHRGGSVLITGSKLGHKSLMLLDIVHTEDSLDLIGSLDRYVKIKPNAEINDEEAIRSPKDYILDISELGEKVRALKGRNRLEKVRYILDEDLRVEPSIEKAFEGIKLEKLEF
jgi:CRISPR-associated protein Cas7/Csh2 subtype I-B